MDKLILILVNNIGMVYYRIKNYSRSLEYYTKAINWNLAKGDTVETIPNLINIGLVYIQLNNLELARSSFENAIHIGKKHSDKLLAHAYYGLGIVFLRKNEAEVSRQYLLKAVEEGRKTQDKRAMANSYGHLTELELKEKSYKNAKHYLDRSEELSYSMNNNLSYYYSYHRYSQLYEALGQPDSAYYYHKKYTALKDSIFTPDLTHNLTNLQLSYQAEESQKAIEEKEQRLSQTTKYLWLAGMVLLICVVQLFRFYHRFL